MTPFVIIIKNNGVEIKNSNIYKNLENYKKYKRKISKIYHINISLSFCNKILT